MAYEKERMVELAVEEGLEEVEDIILFPKYYLVVGLMEERVACAKIYHNTEYVTISFVADADDPWELVQWLRKEQTNT